MSDVKLLSDDSEMSILKVMKEMQISSGSEKLTEVYKTLL
jgi:hypothetical protein